MVVIELLHTYYVFKNTLHQSIKRLGFYTDMEKAQKDILFYSKLPGFCDAPNGFVIMQMEIMGAKPDAHFYEASVYAHTEDFEDFDYFYKLGLFYDEKAAQDAISEFCANNELLFNNPLLEIERLVEKYTINKRCGWVEGFDVIEG